MITWQVIPVVMSWGCFPLTTYHDFLNRILPEAECMNLRKGRKFHILCYLSLSFPFPLLLFLSLPFPVAKRSPLNPTIVVCGALYELSQPGLAYLLIGLCPATSQAYLADDYRRVTNAGVRRLRSADNRTLHAHCFLPDSFMGVVITPLIKNKGDNLTDIYNYRAILFCLIPKFLKGCCCQRLGRVHLMVTNTNLVSKLVTRQRCVYWGSSKSY